VPGSPPADARHPESAADHAADHAAIDRLTEELLPALIAKLGATGLGELEVRQGGWRVRLRRPGGEPAPRRERKSGDRKSGERGSGERPDRAADQPPQRRPGRLTRYRPAP